MGLFRGKPALDAERAIIYRLTKVVIELCRPEYSKEKDEKLIEECANKAQELIMDAFNSNKMYGLSYTDEFCLKRAMGKDFEESGLSIKEYLKKVWMTSIW